MINSVVFNEKEKKLESDVICEQTNDGEPRECHLYFEDLFEVLQIKFYIIKYSTNNLQIEPINGIDQTVFIYNQFQQIEVNV